METINQQLAEDTHNIIPVPEGSMQMYRAMIDFVYGNDEYYFFGIDGFWVPFKRNNNFQEVELRLFKQIFYQYVIKNISTFDLNEREKSFFKRIPYSVSVLKAMQSSDEMASFLEKIDLRDPNEVRTGDPTGDENQRKVHLSFSYYVMSKQEREQKTVLLPTAIRQRLLDQNKMQQVTPRQPETILGTQLFDNYIQFGLKHMDLVPGNAGTSYVGTARSSTSINTDNTSSPLLPSTSSGFIFKPQSSSTSTPFSGQLWARKRRFPLRVLSNTRRLRTHSQDSSSDSQT